MDGIIDGNPKGYAKNQRGAWFQWDIKITHHPCSNNQGDHIRYQGYNYNSEISKKDAHDTGYYQKGHEKADP